MNTPTELWETYRDFVFDQDAPLSESVEFEAKRAFFAGSEAVFKLLEGMAKLPPVHAGRAMKAYREMNRTAAMETIPEDEQE